MQTVAEHSASTGSISREDIEDLDIRVEGSYRIPERFVFHWHPMPYLAPTISLLELSGREIWTIEVVLDDDTDDLICRVYGYREEVSATGKMGPDDLIHFDSDRIPWLVVTEAQILLKASYIKL